MPLSDSELARINTKDIIFIDENTAILYVEHNSLVQTSIPIYTLVKVTGRKLLAVLKENYINGVLFPFAKDEIKQDFSSYTARYISQLLK